MRAALVHCLSEQDRDAPVEGPVMHRPVHRRSDADLHGAPGVDQPLLDCVEERRAVAKALTEALGPGIDMRIEMDERQFTGPRGQRPQQGERDRMIAAKRDEIPGTWSPTGLMF